MKLFPLGLAALLTIAGGPAAAQDRPSTGTTGVPTASHPCASVPLAADRLACYDRAFPPPPAARAEAARAEQAQAEQAFGRRGTGTAAPQETRPALAETAVPDRIEAALTAVERSATGHRIFTLDNGQRWRETEVTSRGVLRVGDRVTIERGAFSSFLLVTPSRVGLRVRRLP
jgi:hypothetical protein